ncbi:hypothetical protein GQ472_03455, partial [archaeon]|nr:hypothetical protein [archaeon]
MPRRKRKRKIRRKAGGRVDLPASKIQLCIFKSVKLSSPMAEKYDVVGFGALNWDDNRQVSEILLPGRETSGNVLDGSPGGSAANTIVGLSRLGIDTAFAGTVGNDETGAELIRNLVDEDVKPLVNVDSGHSGNCLILIDSEGERTIYVFAEVNDTISIDEVSAETLDIIRNAEYFFSSSFACQDHYD